MPKVRLSDAAAEKEEADGIVCKTCSAPAVEGHEPYCTSCALYWQDVANGLFDDRFEDRPSPEQEEKTG